MTQICPDPPSVKFLFSNETFLMSYQKDDMNGIGASTQIKSQECL